jgi:hypothetical protein
VNGCSRNFIVVFLYRASSATSLVHKGRVEVEGLLEDPTFRIVFTVIYEIGMPSVGISDTASKKVFFQL